MPLPKVEPLKDHESEWTFARLEEYTGHIERIATEKYGFDFNENQIEIVSYEQMLDLYTSIGLPMSYDHWSYGKAYAQKYDAYKQGQMGLAYELVINSNPTIAYCMENNTMMMQILVIAHASIGHNTVYKTNYLFKDNTQSDGIIDFVAYAKQYIDGCIDKHGEDEVENILDACHALQNHGIFKYKRKPQLSKKKQIELVKARNAYAESQVDVLWDGIIEKPTKTLTWEEEVELYYGEKVLDEENILYFIEKQSPNLPEWKREIIRIVRKIAQYFYPQMQSSLVHEGAATFIHYTLIHDLYDEGLIPDGFMLEFYNSHSGVIAQPPFDSEYFSGINVYALGFAMMKDIKRVSMEPSDEDVEWFGEVEWVGNGDWVKNIKYAISDFKDETFVQQFLSPTIIREFNLFQLRDDIDEPYYHVDAISNCGGYEEIREKLAFQYSIASKVPDISIVAVDTTGDRSLFMTHKSINGVPINSKPATETLKHIYALWGFDVHMDSIADNGDVLGVHSVTKSGINSFDLYEDNM